MQNEAWERLLGACAQSMARDSVRSANSAGESKALKSRKLGPRPPGRSHALGLGLRPALTLLAVIWGKSHSLLVPQFPHL